MPMDKIMNALHYQCHGIIINHKPPPYEKYKEKESMAKTLNLFYFPIFATASVTFSVIVLSSFLP